jgi:hypothetical protein
MFTLACPQEASDVSDLNDGQLKALLDEAYNYKSPKDRVGKSEIFKVNTGTVNLFIM